MKYLIKPFESDGTVIAPPSKSFAHRAIILSALSKGDTYVKNVGNSADVNATLNCVKALGAKVQLMGDGVIITGIEKLPETVHLDFGESGSTMRFLIPVVCALGVKATFTGRGKLLQRPNEVLYRVLMRHGSAVYGQKISGKLGAGKFKIDARISSQYVSGLLMALPLLKQKSTIILKGTPVSSDYIRMTLDLLGAFNIQYKEEKNALTIESGFDFVSPKEITVEGDWSSAAFPLCYGALMGNVTVGGLNLNSKQADKKILTTLQNYGAKVTCLGDKVTVQSAEKRSLVIDVNGMPDLAPVLASIMAYANGVSALVGVDRLRIKESDRLQAIMQNLDIAGVKYEYIKYKNTLHIYGGKPKGGDYLGFNDHRMVMSACVMASRADGNSTVTDAEAVVKSYPEFFENLKKIKGEWDVIV